MKVLKKSDFLKLFACSKTSKRRKLLTDWAGKEELDALSEIAINALKGNIDLTPKLLSRLKKHRNHLYLLANKKAINKRKSLIKQHGGFLPWIIPLALETASTYANFLKRK